MKVDENQEHLASESLTASLSTLGLIFNSMDSHFLYLSMVNSKNHWRSWFNSTILSTGSANWQGIKDTITSERFPTFVQLKVFNKRGTSLVVQFLRWHTYTAGTTGSTPVYLRSGIPHMAKGKKNLYIGIYVYRYRCIKYIYGLCIYIYRERGKCTSRKKGLKKLNKINKSNKTTHEDLSQ